MTEKRVPRPHAEVRKKFADGYDVEYREPGSDRWIEQPNPSFHEKFEWRVKPETVRYRLFLMRCKDGEAIVGACNECSIDPILMPGFINWLGDWQEVEV